MNDLSVSVVVPNFNYGRFLEAAIWSILRQTRPPLEVIVVDDGSTDNSCAVIEKFGDRIRFIQQKNSGVSIARNRGITESRGDLVAFLDPDDLWMPEKLELQVPLFLSPNTALVYCACYYCDADLKPLKIVNPKRQEDSQLVFKYGPENIIPAGPSNVVIRRRVFSEIGGFDPTLSNWADWDMWRRICAEYEIDAVSRPLSYYRIHQSSMSRQVEKLEGEVRVLLDKVFSDPSTPSRIVAAEKEIRSRWSLMLCGDFFYAGKYWKCLEYFIRAALDSPLALGYVACWPQRICVRLKGRLNRGD